MEIAGEDYQVIFDEPSHTVACQGSFRLGGVQEYAPIVQLLNDAASQSPEKLTLDLRGLQFLNSSGINVLSKFVIVVRQHGTTALVVRGSREVPWQGKSLVNLQRLMPNLQLEWA